MIRKSAFLFTLFCLTAGLTSSALPEEPADKNVISILFAHISNAYPADPNQGLDVLGVRYGIQF
jgi:hypothetical protein